jgi:isoquinoline 1-oxidoreductase beta subunit
MKSTVIHEATGRRANFGELSAEAAALALPVVPLPLKPLADYTIIGTPRGRKNARAIVTGAQKYTMDLGLAEGVPATATPAVVRRPSDIKGRVASINNLAAVQAMPGIVGVVQINLPDRGPVDTTMTAFPQPTGVAVAADTFFHALAARDALDVTWAPGPLASTSDADIGDAQTLNLPLTPVLLRVSRRSTRRSTSLRRTLRSRHERGRRRERNSATICVPSQTPNYQAGQIATALGSPTPTSPCISVRGGAFGRHLFGNPRSRRRWSRRRSAVRSSSCGRATTTCATAASAR